MKLQDVISKLKRARPEVAHFRMPDADRAGDFLIALTLAASLAAVSVASLYVSGYLPGLRLIP